MGASTELGKCFTAVLPWPPGPEVNTEQGRKPQTGWISSSEERGIQEDQTASHSQSEAEQSWPGLLPHLQPKPGTDSPERLQGAGQRKGAGLTLAKL